MKKYIIKYTDESEQTVMQAIHESREEAGRVLMRYLSYHNENCDVDDYLSPFDFKLEEVECEDVNEVITDFGSAVRAIGGKTLQWPRVFVDFNPKHVEALIALTKLLTIAEAWNKEDRFVPDFSDYKQVKWFPWFKYDRNLAKFRYSSTDCTYLSASACLGSKLCFKTRERAEQFGKQFVDLYNEVFL